MLMLEHDALRLILRAFIDELRSDGKSAGTYRNGGGILSPQQSMLPVYLTLASS